MMTQEFMDRNLRETATLWMLSNLDPQRGKAVYAAPVKIRCRWEDGVSRALTSQNEVITVAATTVYVDRDVVDGSRIVKGESVAPVPTTESRVTRSFTRIPQLYAPSVVQRTVQL